MVAGVVAGVLSGAPSTLHALLTGRSPLAAARAAGNVVLPADAPPRRLLVAALPAGPQVMDHIAFGAVTAAVLRRLRRG